MQCSQRVETMCDMTYMPKLESNSDNITKLCPCRTALLSSVMTVKASGIQRYVSL